MFKAICVTFLFALCTKSSQAFPFHASCKIDWEWPNNDCSYIQAGIVAQIQKWNNTDCGTGEKCRYQLISKNETLVIATHTTPVKHYVDDLTFQFQSQDGGCHVEGNSRSEVWYAVLDYGTNYCNLHNLITGAALDKVSGYKETTSNSVCTQYSSANCEKY